jgi:hypothetical protein
MRRMPVALAIAGLGIATAMVSMRTVQRDPAFSFAGPSVVGRVALFGAGLALVAAGLAFWLRRPGSSFGLLLVAGGFAWFLLEWNSPGVRSSLAFTAGLVLYAHCAAFVGVRCTNSISGRGAVLMQQSAEKVAPADIGECTRHQWRRRRFVVPRGRA